MKLFNSSTAYYASAITRTATTSATAIAAAYAAAYYSTTSYDSIYSDEAEKRIPLYGPLYKTMLSLCVNTRKAL